MPRDGWVCFHCGERFTTYGAAEDHFGKTPEAKVGCLINTEERGLLMSLRRAEEEVASNDYLFEMRHSADMRAIKRWHDAGHPQLLWPDHADLMVWLVEQLERA